jgi:hypothetical protein
MGGQNILKFYGSKLNLKLDFSETYDFIIDTSEWVDLVLDYSEEYDIQLDYTPDFDDNIIKVLYEITEFGCDYTILTQDEFSILTQNEECIQYQY